MQVIKIKVTQTDVTITEKPEKITAENYNQIKCIFDLDEAFDNLIVRASFNGEYATVENGECFAPVLKQGNCSLGVYGYAVVDEKLERRISPSPKMFYVDEGSYNENDAEGDNPTPTELEEHYNRVKELVDSGKLKGDPGEKGDKGDKGDTGATGATGPQGPPGKDAVTDTEMSTESDNAIANSTVSKVLAYGNLIGFEKIDSYEEFEEFNAKYPVGVSEDDFLVLYITSDLSYSDINGSFDCPPGLYVITADNFFRLCPDAESVNSLFKNIEEMMSYWYALAASKANQTELDALKTNLDDVSDTADEALTVARGRNRALCFFTKQELDSWLNGEFQREDGKTKADLQVGDNLYIVEVGVPDYWWDGEQVRPLETQKVDLSEYAEKEYVDEKVEQEVSVPNGDIANYLDVADILGIWKNATAGRTDFSHLFENSTVKTIPMLDTSSGKNFPYMFKGCSQLETVPLLDTSNATNMLQMFYGCSSLKILPAFNTSKVTNMFNLVHSCTSITSFKGFDTSNVTNMNGMFYGCTSLEEVEIDMSSAVSASFLFRDCSALVSAKTLNLSKVSDYSNIFTDCRSLEHLEFVPESIKHSITMGACSLLDSDSVASIFEGLADLTDSETQTLTLHKNVQITQAQADAAVAKNWNIVGGTVNG